MNSQKVLIQTFKNQFSTSKPIKRVAVLGGSFDPPTISHLQVRIFMFVIAFKQAAAEIINLFQSNEETTDDSEDNSKTSQSKSEEQFSIDEVWIVPCGLRPDKPNLSNPNQRLEMINKAVNDFFPPNFSQI